MNIIGILKTFFQLCSEFSRYANLPKGSFVLFGQVGKSYEKVNL